ncbi:monoacylglycerol lipase ABHD12 isoform 1 [Tropilaelaps mercedesae]|uniref:Protein ABHD13 n=1 Tax=Tropilaelaps mercedesae TaxID=418985 RepID=A0A1V9XKI9_9ACAR|nr:monoacylglycerol lipase ABHD12 isoform 1 [Tropilaelaps mercedesae]
MRSSDVSTELSFFGSASRSPTTEDIKKFAKPRSAAESNEKTTSVVTKNLKNHTDGSARQLEEVSVKLNKNIQFSVKAGKAKNPISLKNIIINLCSVLICIISTLIVLTLIAVFIIFPLAFASSLSLRQRMMFVGWIRNSPSSLQNPTSLGLHDAKLIKITDIHAWYIPPALNVTCDEESSAERPLILFVPSFGEIRSSLNTVAMLKTLTQVLCYHVVAFDYRGTADSGGPLPSARTVLYDAREVLEQVLSSEQHITNKTIVLWGNTWGAPISLKLANEFYTNIENGALVLQSPIESTEKAAGTGLAFNILWRWMPYFYTVFVKTLQDYPETYFNTVEEATGALHLKTIVIHGKNDDVVDLNQGINVYRQLEVSRLSGNLNSEYLRWCSSKDDEVGHYIAHSSMILECLRHHL